MHKVRSNFYVSLQMVIKETKRWHGRRIVKSFTVVIMPQSLDIASEIGVNIEPGNGFFQYATIGLSIGMMCMLSYRKSLGLFIAKFSNNCVRRPGFYLNRWNFDRSPVIICTLHKFLLELTYYIASIYRENGTSDGISQICCFITSITVWLRVAGQCPQRTYK